MSIDELMQEAMKLPAEARAELADQLVESLTGEAKGELEKVWAVEAEKRREEVRLGQVTLIGGDEVLAEARKRVGR